MNSVFDKMSLAEQAVPSFKKIDLTTSKQLGKNNYEVRTLGKSNQKIKKRLR